MVKGLERRPEVKDTLKGESGIAPVLQKPTRLRGVATPKVPDTSFTDRITGSVQKFASGKLKEIQKRQQEESLMEGKIAALQGESFDNVKMEGDKFALEGFRLITAQSLSSGLLAAQQAEINQGGFEQDPETYRATLTNRIGVVLDGIDDERTRELAREQLMSQVPTLVDEQTRKNLDFKEQQNFDALAEGIDVLSKDPTKTDQLISIATGESELTKGLSSARQREAVTQGVINAFTNGNPNAFAKLKDSGVFNTDNLTAAQINRLRSAKSAYESNLRSKINVDRRAAWDSFITRVNAGDFSPGEAVKKAEEVRAEFDLELTNAEAGNIYELAKQGVSLKEGTRATNLRAAQLRNDFGAMAALMQQAVIDQESAGDPNAVSSKGATGIMQLMPDTAVDPGFGVRNIFEVARDLGYDVPDESEGTLQSLLRNEEVNKVQGTEFLEAMLERYNGNTTKALAAYNAGPGRIDKWDGITMSDLPKETQNYVRTITAALNTGTPDPEGKLKVAEARLKTARETASLRAWERVAPELDDLDQEYINSNMPREEWLAQRGSILAPVMADLTQKRVISSMKAQIEVARDKADQVRKQVELDAREEITPRLVEADELFKAGKLTEEEWKSKTLDLYGESGLTKGPERLNQEAQILRSVAKKQISEDITNKEQKARRSIDPDLAELHAEVLQGNISRAEWEARVDILHDEAGVDLSDSTRREMGSIRQKLADEKVKKDNFGGDVSANITLLSGVSKAEEGLNANLEAFASGDTDKTLSDIQAEFSQSMFDAFSTSGITPDPEAVANKFMELAKMSNLAEKAAEMKERNTAIAAALSAEDVGELPKELQDIAIDRESTRIEKEVEIDAVENGWNNSQKEIEQRKRWVDWLARQGVIDPTVKRNISIGANINAWMNNKGEINPAVPSAIHMFASLFDKNPDLAMQYVPDKESQGRMLAAVRHLQSVYPDLDVIKNADLSDRNNPLTNLVYETVKQMALANKDEEPEGLQDSIDSAKNTNEGSFFFSNFAQKQIPTTALYAVTNSTELADVTAGRSIDREAVVQQYNALMERRVKQLAKNMSGLTSEEIVNTVNETLPNRIAIAGSSIMVPEPTEPSIISQMFRGNVSGNPSAPNTAIVEWFQSEEAQENNPRLAEWYRRNNPIAEATRRVSPFAEAAPGTRASPDFTVRRVQGLWVANLEGVRGTVILPPLGEIGDAYLKRRNLD